MTDRSCPIPFDDIPLDQACRMGRGPRIDPEPVSRLPGESPDDRSRPLDPPTAPTADTSPRPSKSQRKREAHALQALGAQLVALPRAHLARIALPDALREAVVTAQSLRPHGARRRHLQYIGTLMRQLDAAELRRVHTALAPTHAVRPRPQPEPEELGGPLTGAG
jgi:ribosome-associated protein